jgi:polysaccharide export outer membrane protein
MRINNRCSIGVAAALGAIALALAPDAGAQTPQTTPRTTSTSQRTTPPSTSAARPEPIAATVTRDYVLAVGDKLRIEVYREGQLSQAVEVRPDGKITLPMVGDVTAVGLTPRDLGAALTERLREYLTNPVVTVIVAEATPPAIYVMGEVNAPGAVEMRTPITVLQALAMAGGFKEFAKRSDIRILRRTAAGIETIRFNYKDAVEKGGRPAMLQPGDTVIVP